MEDTFTFLNKLKKLFEVIFSTSASLISRISEICLIVCIMKLGIFVFPRFGTGAKKGESVSTKI